MRGIRNIAIGIALLGVVVAGVLLFVSRGGGSEERPSVAADTPADAAVKRNVPPPPAPDAGMNKDDILAISRFGYLTVTANQKTTIFVDGKFIGETPMTRLPLAPGPKKIKAVGPKNKKKEFTTTILGGQDAEPIDIVW